MLEQLAEGQAEQIFQKVLEGALAGDGPCQKMLMDRLWPPRKGQPVNVAMPAINTSQDVFPAIASIWTGIREGRLTPEEASALSIVIDRSIQAIALHDIIKRIAALEGARDKRDEKKSLRQLEALEEEERSREQKELSSLKQAVVYIWDIVFAYYLGDLKSDENRNKDDDENIEGERDDEDENEDVGSPAKEYARALQYPSHDDFCRALRKKDSEIPNRYYDAYCRLFAKVGLDFASAPTDVLFAAFVTMVNELPDQWLNWLRSNLGRLCSDAELAPGSNLPRRLSRHNFLLFYKVGEAVA